MNTDTQNVFADELIPYYEKVHGAVELLSELHAVPVPTAFEHGNAVGGHAVSKRIRLLTGVRIDTFTPNVQRGAAPSMLLAKGQGTDIIDPVISMSLFLKNA